MNLIYAFPEPLPMARARGLQTVHTAVGLARAGVSVALYHAPGDGHPTRYYGIEPPESLRLVATSRAILPPFPRPHSNRAFLARLLRVTRRAADADVVMIRHLKLAALFLDRVPEKPLVYEAHEVFADTAPAGKAATRSIEEGRVVRGAAAIVCTSASVAARLEQLYGAATRFEVVPNGVERPERLPPKDWENAAQHVIYAGSLYPWKGAADLVVAATHMDGGRIEILGGEPERIAELAALRSNRGAEVVMSGHVSHAEAMERIARACIAVLPNRRDTVSGFTSPIKLFEYMAAGCAVVATDLPVFREILAEDEAVWAQPGDPESLARAIGSLARDPARARALGERLREKSRDYTWTARAARMKAILEEAARR